MNKIYSMLGIARKGGNISIGYDVTCLDVKDKKSKLVLIAEDASDKTKKNIQFFCDKYEIKYVEYGEKEILGKSLGKKMVSVLSVNDTNIANYLLNNI
ncbi:MAG: L7Ae/L30e/S12e/Gadd45 family ribosomal protein [Sedimentibacter sp.]